MNDEERAIKETLASLFVFSYGTFLMMSLFLAGCGADFDSLSKDVNNGITITALGSPDLVVRKITRNKSYYYIDYCNEGHDISTSTFTLQTKNIITGDAFTSNSLYPFAVPAPGTCATTGGLTCGLIGDPSCSRCMAVQAYVDSDNQVTESNETNNTLTALIGCSDLPDLTIKSITRDLNYYYITFCNTGKFPSASTFTIQTVNIITGDTFISNSLYPFAVPPPGTCTTTGGLTCGLIGDPSCSLPVTIRSSIDSSNTVAESIETNNTLVVNF